MRIGADKEANQARINSKLGQVEVYMNANKLKFNAGKTQIMIMTPARNRMNNNLEINFNGHLTKPEESARFLGITISMIFCGTSTFYKIQAILTETYRIVYNDRHSSTKDLFQKTRVLTFNGSISYLDFFPGKNIKDHMKPSDLAGKIGMVQLT